MKEESAMNVNPLSMPLRSVKPRQEGLTVVIDNGIPVGVFEDAIASAAYGIDLVKFGWGTALVTPRLKRRWPACGSTASATSSSCSKRESAFRAARCAGLSGSQ